MTGIVVTVVAILLGCFALGIHVATTIGFTALFSGWLFSPRPLWDALAYIPWNVVSTTTLVALPLFVLMGELLLRIGVTDTMYTTLAKWLTRLPGGLVHTNVVSSGLFACVSGSSAATAATVGSVALPYMRRRGYDNRLTLGSIAAGGTLGILIPPSVIMVIYGIMTQTSIGALFAAGFIPGLLALGLYMLAARLVTARNPELGPPGERTAWRDRWLALRDVWAVLLLFVIVIGGMYTGWFTPTEAAGVGAFGGFLFALARGTLTWRGLWQVLVESSQTTAMLFTIVIGAQIFSNFINFTTLPTDLSEFVTRFQVNPIMVVVVICLIYVVLGCAMESLSMMLLTVPIFFPLVQGLGFDAVWFGVLIVCVIEISLITPPVGMNVFVLSSVLPDVPTSTIWRGVLPFIAADLVRLAILIAFPTITLFLPQLLNL